MTEKGKSVQHTKLQKYTLSVFEWAKDCCESTVRLPLHKNHKIKKLIGFACPFYTNDFWKFHILCLKPLFHMWTFDFRFIIQIYFSPPIIHFFSRVNFSHVGCMVLVFMHYIIVYYSHVVTFISIHGQFPGQSHLNVNYLLDCVWKIQDHVKCAGFFLFVSMYFSPINLSMLSSFLYMITSINKSTRIEQLLQIGE